MAEEWVSQSSFIKIFWCDLVLQRSQLTVSVLKNRVIAKKQCFLNIKVKTATFCPRAKSATSQNYHKYALNSMTLLQYLNTKRFITKEIETCLAIVFKLLSNQYVLPIKKTHKQPSNLEFHLVGSVLSSVLLFLKTFVVFQRKPIQSFGLHNRTNMSTSILHVLLGTAMLPMRILQMS